MDNEITKRIISSIFLLPLTFFCIIKGAYFFYFFLGIIFIIASLEWHFMSKNKSYYFFGYLFLSISIFSAYKLRIDFGNDFFTILVVTTICIFTDIGGYVFGKTFKGPKLTNISPNKTYAGVFGSFLFSIIAGLIFIKYYLTLSTNIKNDQFFILSLILFISFVSQIGDLIISYFKRKAKLKDTGKILPGHGGLLDRIDGLIFVLPAIYLLQLIK